MNGENASLMTRKQVIDEVTDDRVGFVAEFCDNPTDERAAACVPFQIDRPMRGFAVDFSPSMRATRTLMFSGNQIKTPKLRIVHDLVPQRSAAGRDYLNHSLHRFVTIRPNDRELQIRIASVPLKSELQQGPKHDINVDVSFFRMTKCTRQSADDFEPELFP